MTQSSKAPEKYRVDVVDFGTVRGYPDPHWASNGLRFDTREDATAYADNLSWSWLALAAYRVVPADTPTGEEYTEESADKTFYAPH